MVTPAPSSLVTMTIFCWPISTILFRKLNSSVSLSLSLRKLRQFVGIFPWPGWAIVFALYPSSVVCGPQFVSNGIPSVTAGRISTKDDRILLWRSSTKTALIVLFRCTKWPPEIKIEKKKKRKKKQQQKTTKKNNNNKQQQQQQQ